VGVLIGRRLTPLLPLLLLSLAGCAHSNDPAPTPTVRTPAPEQPKRDYSNYYPPGTHKPTAEQTRIVTAWADELRAGHVRRAASYFSRPVIVQNASPPMRLSSKQEVFDFNNTLPCGAHIVKTIATEHYVVATFVLVLRPGSPACGATGKLAATAFRLRHGKISEWRRVLVPPPLGPAENLQRGKPVS
jgi:hypothetical protein